jgi:hypothetical protein
MKDQATTNACRRCRAELCEDFAKTYERLERALAGFERRKWFIVESDSSDDTVGALQRLAAASPEFAFRSLGHSATRFPARTERIAHCRNVLSRRDPRTGGPGG